MRISQIATKLYWSGTRSHKPVITGRYTNAACQLHSRQPETITLLSLIAKYSRQYRHANLLLNDGSAITYLGLMGASNALTATHQIKLNHHPLHGIKTAFPTAPRRQL